jgi:hypothetical protein
METYSMPNTSWQTSMWQSKQSRDFGNAGESPFTLSLGDLAQGMDTEAVVAFKILERERWVRADGRPSPLTSLNENCADGANVDTSGKQLHRTKAAKH